MFLLFLTCVSHQAFGQSQFYAISSSYDDSAREWSIYYVDNEGDEERATLYLKWPFRNDWTEWSLDLGPNLYSIRQMYNLLPVQWTLSGPDSSISIRQKWRGDNNIWVISYGDKKIIWRTDVTNNFDVWYMQLSEEEYFDMWTVYPGDSRDWDIEDKTATLPIEVKVAAIFTTVYLTSPKY